MRRTIVTLGLMLAAATPACAHRHQHPHRHHHRHHTVGGRPSAPGFVTVATAAHIPITVAAALAARFQALIADFVTAGYTPRHIGCAARSGHVAHSRHYAGAACDFDQSGWGRTAPFMRSARAHELIARHGFRDGREFRDQGHVDDGGVRYAHNVRRSRYGG